MTHPMVTAPERVCANCYRTWRAANPRPAAVYCHHTHTLAWPTLAGWQTERPSDAALRRLRAGGLL